MKFADLPDFSSPETWGRRAVNRAPEKPGVYILRLAGGRTFGRLLGVSDLLYIGSSAKHKQGLRGRLTPHLKPRGDSRDVGYRIKSVEDKIGPLEVAWTVCTTPEQARHGERELLRRCLQDHLELPPLNRQETGKPFMDLYEWAKEAPVEDLRQLLEPLRRGTGQGLDLPEKA